MHAEQPLPPPDANPTSMVKDDALVSYQRRVISSNERPVFHRIPSRIMEVISRVWYHSSALGWKRQKPFRFLARQHRILDVCWGLRMQPQGGVRIMAIPSFRPFRGEHPNVFALGQTKLIRATSAVHVEGRGRGFRSRRVNRRLPCQQARWRRPLSLHPERFPSY
jgi:hypothetical protein